MVYDGNSQKNETNDFDINHGLQINWKLNNELQSCGFFHVSCYFFEVIQMNGPNNLSFALLHTASDNQLT